DRGIPARGQGRGAAARVQQHARDLFHGQGHAQAGGEVVREGPAGSWTLRRGVRRAALRPGDGLRSRRGPRQGPQPLHRPLPPRRELPRRRRQSPGAPRRGGLGTRGPFVAGFLSVLSTFLVGLILIIAPWTS